MGHVLDNSFDYFIKSKFEEISEGEWVAIYNGKLVYHNKDLKKVLEKAKETAPLSKILISKVKKSATYL